VQIRRIRHYLRSEMEMNKLLIPTILTATVLIAGMFAFLPVEKVSTVHDTIIAALDGADNDDLTTVKDAINQHAIDSADVTQGQIADTFAQVASNFAAGQILGTEVNVLTLASQGKICFFVEAANAGELGNIQLMIDNADDGTDLENEIGDLICRTGTSIGVLDDNGGVLDQTLELNVFGFTDAANPADPAIP